MSEEPTRRPESAPPSDGATGRLEDALRKLAQGEADKPADTPRLIAPRRPDVRRPRPISYLPNDGVGDRQRASLGWVFVSTVATVAGVVLSLLILGVVMLWKWGLS